MENAVQALKMAAAVLVFIIAIASSFSLFGTAKQTADSIITMRDKQAYLDAAELDNGILYTSSSAIEGETGLNEEEVAEKFGVTQRGDRIVSVEDVVSTIYRYSTEKYGVTIVQGSTEKVLARFDSATESEIKALRADQLTIEEESFKEYSDEVLNNIKTIYCKNPSFNGANNHILELYQITNTNNPNFQYGAPWYGEVEREEISRRIACDLAGTDYTYNGQIYKGKGLLDILNDANYIVEVANEIDKTTYLEDDLDGDGNKDFITNLPQQFEMPTVEIVYIIID